MAYPKRNDTLGDLIRSGSGITAYCQAQHCDRGLMDVDIYDLAMLFGTRSRYVGMPWPLKCSVCGSKDVTFRDRAGASAAGNRHADTAEELPAIADGTGADCAGDPVPEGVGLARDREFANVRRQSNLEISCANS